MILIQYMNARDEFRYLSPHPQVMRYLGYRIGGKKGTRGEKMREHWLHIGMGI